MNAIRTALAFGLAVVVGDSAFAQETTRVSVDAAGNEGNTTSWEQSISPSGRYIAFASAASNLVANDANGNIEDVFVFDRSTGVPELVSVDSSGAAADDVSFAPSISADGQFIAFSSTATNLVSGDSNGVADIFVHDRSTGSTTRVSVDSSGSEAHGDSYGPSVSGDGQIVAFWSYASDLVAADTNGTSDVFVQPTRPTAFRSRSLDFPRLVPKDRRISWNSCDACSWR